MITTLTLLALAADANANAALRYWHAFEAMKTQSVTPERANQLNAVLQGAAPYRDREYRPLIDDNRRALDLLPRGALLESCDWGIDLDLGADAPIEYARKALGLGRLNVLYAYHLDANNQRAPALERIAVGLRFSRHAAHGGPLFAALAAKSLLVAHLRAIEFLHQRQPLTAAQKQRLAAALQSARLDWGAAMRVELDVALRPSPPSGVAALYGDALADPSKLAQLEALIERLPPDTRARIPRPARVLDEQRDLQAWTDRVKALLGG